MNIGSDLKLSISQLMSHRYLIIPSVLASLLPFLTLAGLIYVTDLDDVAAEFVTQSRGFAERFDESDDNAPTLVQYLEANGMHVDEIRQRIAGHIWIFMLTFAVNILLSYYLICLSYILIVGIFSRKKVNLRKALIQTNAKFIPFVSLKMLILLLLFGPILLIGIIALIAMAINQFIGAVMVIGLIALYVFYLIYISIRLFFIIPFLFMEKRKVLETIPQSVRTTRKRIPEVFLLLLVVTIISILTNSAIRPSISSTFSEFFLTLSTQHVISAVIALAILILINSILATLQKLITFNAYKRLKKTTTPMDRD